MITSRSGARFEGANLAHPAHDHEKVASAAANGRRRNGARMTLNEPESGRLLFEFIALGDIATQGSKDAFAIHRGSEREGTREFTGRVAVVDNDPKLKAWRETVRKDAEAIRDARTSGKPWEPFTGPLRVSVAFSVARPKTVPKNRMGWPCVKPDVDKYARAVLDSLTDALIWGDDGQAVILRATKLYGVLPRTGALIQVHSLNSSAEMVARSLVVSSAAYRRMFGDRA